MNYFRTRVSELNSKFFAGNYVFDSDGNIEEFRKRLEEYRKAKEKYSLVDFSLRVVFHDSGKFILIKKLVIGSPKFFYRRPGHRLVGTIRATKNSKTTISLEHEILSPVKSQIIILISIGIIAGIAAIYFYVFKNLPLFAAVSMFITGLIFTVIALIRILYFTVVKNQMLKKFTDEFFLTRVPTKGTNA